MRSSKYTEHYTGTFITFKEIMRTVSNIYHNCIPDKNVYCKIEVHNYAT